VLAPAGAVPAVAAVLKAAKPLCTWSGEQLLKAVPQPHVREIKDPLQLELQACMHQQCCCKDKLPVVTAPQLPVLLQAASFPRDVQYCTSAAAAVL
jgi:hypothetical protein